MNEGAYNIVELVDGIDLPVERRQESHWAVKGKDGKISQEFAVVLIQQALLEKIRDTGRNVTIEHDGPVRVSHGGDHSSHFKVDKGDVIQNLVLAYRMIANSGRLDDLGLIGHLDGLPLEYVDGRGWHLLDDDMRFPCPSLTAVKRIVRDAIIDIFNQRGYVTIIEGNKFKVTRPGWVGDNRWGQYPDLTTNIINAWKDLPDD